MATRARNAIVLRSAPVARRSGPSPKLQKLEARLASVARRARDISSETESAMITVGVPAVLGLLRANGTVLPSFGGFHPLLVWGAPLALAGDKMIGGSWGRRVRAAGIGMLACAANDAGHRGTFKVAGDEIGASEIGADDDEVGADDDDL
jgi:hypothetical protein